MISANIKNIEVIDTTLTVLASDAYDAGDLVANKISIALPAYSSVRAWKGLILGATLFDKAAQAVAYTLTLFNADPSGTTFTKDSALTVADADLLKIIGQVSFPTANAVAFADNRYTSGDIVGSAFKVGIPFELANGASTIYGALTTAGTPTYAATTDLVLRVQVGTLYGA